MALIVRIFKWVLMFAAFLGLVSCSNPLQRTETGIVYSLEDTTTHSIEKISIDVLSQNIIKVAVATNDSLLTIPSLIATQEMPDKVFFDVDSRGGFIIVSTDSLSVYLEQATGEISFCDKAENLLLKTGANEIIPYERNQISFSKIKQNFSWKKGEALYGLGQHELATLNLRGQKVELSQHNTRVSIPVLLSTEGYGLYWDNYSQSYYNDTNDSSYLASDVADKIQYYFVKGEQFDDVIAGLRNLTGESPMLPRWAFGYFQSRNRYKTRDELMSVVKKHRALKIPLDAIILDYMHWGDKGFGSMVFDSTDFPDAEGMIEDLHSKYNCKIITSVWPSFNKGIPNWELFAKDSLLLGLHLNDLFGDVYDAYNPEAGKLYWSLVKKSYWDKGVDGIWFDATEPEQIEKFKNTNCYLGPSIKYQNLFSYFDMKNVFENQMKTDTNRVYVLTRSAFLGQQKFGAVVWSGDIKTDFEALKQQIPTGLNFCMTGLPYWNTDIGGYLGGDPKDKNYQEVFVRWFQYGAFTPMFRAHGRRHPIQSRSGENEVWSFGKASQEILTQSINLRYRLLPYIYSLSNKVSEEGYTLMRALVFDFMEDAKVHNITDQFLFGDIMVCPVTEAGATEREVYLPKACSWYDFWTGKKYTGGQTIIAAAPIDKIPLYVKEGTILPLADAMQYSSEKALDNVELRIYPGKDAKFTLYEDEGNNNNYLKGQSSKIGMSYSDKDRVLKISVREGGFNGMLKEREFNITVVDEQSGTGIGISKDKGQLLNYAGIEGAYLLH